MFENRLVTRSSRHAQMMMMKKKKPIWPPVQMLILQAKILDLTNLNINSWISMPRQRFVSTFPTYMNEFRGRWAFTLVFLSRLSVFTGSLVGV